MLSRWYSIFLGLVLIVMGIAAFLAPQFLGAANMSNWTPTIWLITGVVALIVGLAVRSVNTLRWFSGIVGGLYLLWGVIALFSRPANPLLSMMDLLSTIIVIIGSLGVASALAPAYWLREHETYAPGHA